MNLHFGENLKALRRERNMTQEALAETLGLSVQAISRYETGAAYPDIELLPVIAGFFGVTVDSILGVSAKMREARREEYIERFMAVKGAEAKLAVLHKWRTEFPDDWNAVYCTLVALGEVPAEKRDTVALRSLAKSALKRCTDPHWHDLLIFGYLSSEDDEQTALDFIRAYGSEADLSKLNLMMSYYGERDERKMRTLYQYQQWRKTHDLLNFLTQFRYGGDVRSAIEGCELALDFLQKLTHNPDLTKPDLWYGIKLMALLRLSNNYLFYDEREKGFEALDTAIALIENMVDLPDGTILSFGSPKFDTLDSATVKGVSIYGVKDSLFSCNGLAIQMKYVNSPFAGEDPLGSDAFFPSNYRTIIVEPRWRNFKRYREDTAYQKYAERIKKAVDITERRNVEYILANGVVRNPNGGRLCAVKTNDRENLRLLYVLEEDPKTDFAKALAQFRETAALFGITEAEAVMTVDGEQKTVETPKEVETGIAV